jgi:hypothetical protein
MAASLAEVAMESQQDVTPADPGEIREARKGSVDAHRGLDMVRRSTGSPKRPGQGRWHSSGTPQATPALERADRVISIPRIAPVSPTDASHSIAVTGMFNAHCA